VNRLKRYAAAMLACGVLLAVSTPAYLMSVAPSTRVYLGHPVLFLMQVLPYALCAALWLPSRERRADTMAFILSLALLLAACILYFPILIHPERSGSDMIGLGFAIICIVTTLALLGIWLLGFVIARWPRHHHRA
jgi:cytochrome bd-type quinol oxidase subunit 2